MAQLNEALAEQQKITDKQREKLYNLYDYMYELIKQANETKNLTPQKGKDFSERMKTLEFNLQENWNFPQDPLFHTWWNEFNECKCPKMDNAERFGHPKIINGSCLFHGHL